MRHLYFAPIIILLFCQHSMFATAITGSVLNEENKPLEFVSVTIHAIDSTLIAGDITNAAGEFHIALNDMNASYIQFHMIGFMKYSMKLDLNLSDKEIQLNPITLLEATETLDEVTIVEKRPFIERHLDKLIVNVKNSIVDAGSNAFEVLEKAPGIFIDQEGGLSLNGQGGVRVMIDGKPARMSGPDLASFLQSMPTDAVDKLEIISNPSAKYDAEGTSGIINIVRNREAGLGTNGSYNISYGRGMHHRFNTGIQLNHRTKKSNIFGNYNLGYNERLNHLLTYRRFSSNGQLTNIFDQDATLIIGTKSHTSTVGYDYYVNKKTTVGFLVAGHIRNFNPKGDGISNILDANQTFTGGFSSTNRSTDTWGNYSINGNIVHQFNDKGKSIKFDLDYARFQNETEQLFTTQFFNESNIPTGKEYLRGDISGHLKLYTAKIDISLPAGNIGSFDTGLKSSLVKNDNDLKYFDQLNGEDILDINQSNHFLYDEQIHAGYITWNKIFGKWNIQVGLRGEQTIADGIQLTSDTAFHRNYFQLFPSVFINYNASEDHLFNISIGRRINRPSYRQLNPFRGFVDITTARDGNPFLQPESTINTELGYTYKQRYTATLTYARTTDNMINVLLQDDVEKLTIVTFVNIGVYNYIGLSFSGSFNPIKNLTSRIDGSAFYNEYIGVVSSVDLNEKGSSFYISNNNSYQFGNGWSGELNLTYRPRFTYGISVMEPMTRLDAGVQKVLFQGKGRLRFNIRDIFWRAYPRGYTGFANIDEEFESIRDTRTASLSFSYRFGDQKISPARRRQTGAEEEKRRAS